MVNVKTTLVQTNNTALSGNAATWKSPLATTYGFFAVATNEATIQRPAGVYSNLRCRVVTNTNNNTTVVRVNNNAAVGNNSISIATTLTGVFEDISHTDTVVAGNNAFLECSVVNGSTGSITFALTQIDFLANSDTHNTLSSHGSVALATASTTNYHHLSATLSTAITTETDAQIQFRNSFTLKNLRIRILTDNRSTNTTYRIRKNAANGSQSVATTNTGEFEDTTNTDTIVANDKITVQSVTSTGTGTQTFAAAAIDVQNTTNSSFPFISTAGQTQNFGVTRYETAGLCLALTTETSAQIKLYKASTLKNLGANISANTVNGTTTIRTRKNAVDANPVVSVGSSTTGFFTDNSSTTTTANGDLINFSLVTAGTSGSITYRTLYLEVAPNFQVSQTKTHKYNIIGKVTKSKTHKYNIIGKITKSKTHKYNIIIKVTKSKTHKYNIITKVTKTKTHKYNVIGKVTKSKAHKYHVDTNTIKLVKRDLDDDVDFYGKFLTKQTGSDTSIPYEVSTIGGSITFITPRNHIFKLDWENGNWIIRLRVTTANSNVHFTGATIYRFSNDTNFSRGFVYTEFDIPISSTGVYAFNLPWNDDSQNADPDRAEDDRVYLELYLSNASGINQTFEYGVNLSNFNDEITTPIPVPTQVTKSKTHKYNIEVEALTQVSTTKTHKYNVIGKVTTSKTHKYNIIGKVTKSTTHKYNIIGKVTVTKTHKYNIIGKITATKTHKYHIEGKVTRTHTHKYNIIVKVSTSKTHKYNVLISIATTKTHKYNILVSVSTTRTHKYNVIEKLIVSKTHRYNVAGIVTRTHTHKYNIVNRVTTTKIHVYDILVKTSVTKTHKFNIISAVIVTKTHKYNLKTRINVTKTHKFNVLARISKSKTHIYNILIKTATASKTHRYNILTSTSKSKTHKYNIIGRVVRTHTHKYSLGGRIVVTKRHIYDLGEGFTPAGQGGGPTNVRIRFPERIRIKDIISDIRNLAIANVEIFDSQIKPQNIAIGLVELLSTDDDDARNPSIGLRTASSTRYKLRAASSLIVPEIQNHISNTAVSDRIALEILPLGKTPQITLQASTILRSQNPILLNSRTQLRQTKKTIISLASATQIIAKQPRITSIASIELPYSKSIIKVAEVMTRDEYSTIHALIDLLKNDDLFY